jgi:hypothetical protein
LSLGSADRQIGHEHAITGTPCEVPVPKKVILTGSVMYTNIFISIGRRYSTQSIRLAR